MTNLSLEKETYLVIGSKPWNRRLFEKEIVHMDGVWEFIGSRENFDVDTIRSINPKFIFFLHWSWKVPDEIIHEYDCVCFHMTNLPYGKGGSPLQNLIIRGHKSSMLTAFKMTHEFDGGPVYLKKEISLHGNAEEILIRANKISLEMIKEILQNRLLPVPQEGEEVIFKRRKPSESEMPELSSLEEVYDFIRMLDAKDYPKAFIDYKDFRLEFTHAGLYDNHVIADVRIFKKGV